MGRIEKGEMMRAGSRQGPEVEVLSHFGDVAAKGVGVGIRSCKAVEGQHWTPSGSRRCPREPSGELGSLYSLESLCCWWVWSVILSLAGFAVNMT